MGPAFCFMVLEKALAQLKAGDPADQAKAAVIEDNIAFANLGALGPLLRDYTPLTPEDFAVWRETRDLQETEFTSLAPDQQIKLITLHRRALMVGYGELFHEVQTQWPLLENAYALLDELDQIAADKDLLALNAKKDAIEALGAALKSESDGGEAEGDGTRPLATLGGGSPDIAVEGPTTTIITLTGIAHLVPAPGSTQALNVRVWNLGSDASVTARVRFWEVRTLQGTDPEPALIGQAFQGVPGQSTISVPCPVPWKPTNPHRLSVMVDVSDSVHDPITAAFEPFADRHTAQKIIVRE